MKCIHPSGHQISASVVRHKTMSSSECPTITYRKRTLRSSNFLISDVVARYRKPRSRTYSLSTTTIDACLILSFLRAHSKCPHKFREPDRRQPWIGDPSRPLTTYLDRVSRNRPTEDSKVAMRCGTLWIPREAWSPCRTRAWTVSHLCSLTLRHLADVSSQFGTIHTELYSSSSKRAFPPRRACGRQ